jgi:hypothetical protein
MVIKPSSRRPELLVLSRLKLARIAYLFLNRRRGLAIYRASLIESADCEFSSRQRPGRAPHPYPGRQRDHRAASALMTAHANSLGVVIGMRARMPVPKVDLDCRCIGDRPLA